nr:MAG TPA: iron-binding zinc finger protein [Bacteriophage sp.]
MILTAFAAFFFLLCQCGHSNHKRYHLHMLFYHYWMHIQ